MQAAHWKRLLVEDYFGDIELPRRPNDAPKEMKQNRLNGESFLENWQCPVNGRTSVECIVC